jgi:hypothetical protein
MAVTRKIPGGDLVLTGGTLVVLGYTAETRLQYIRQKIAARFKFYLGEWFLDQRQGTPYYRDVFTKNPDLQLIRSLFVRIVRETPGVLDVPEFELVYDPAARSVGFSFAAVATDGDIVVKPKDADFLLELA